MLRPILDESNIHPAIREKIASHEQAIVREVQAAVVKHAVVVVGMGMNPFPKKACKALAPGVEIIAIFQVLVGHARGVQRLARLLDRKSVV